MHTPFLTLMGGMARREGLSQRGWHKREGRKKIPAAMMAMMTAHGRDDEDDIFGRDKLAKNNNQQTKGIVSGVCGLGRG
jgi:hypothetical protein